MSPFRKCLLAGACGDALGGPVEFMSHEAILARFGPEGIRSYHEAYGVVGAITDDTQMTLFCADGLLRAAQEDRLEHPDEDLAAAFLDWLATQEGAAPSVAAHPVLRDPRLRSRRAPGNTCLQSLHALRSGRTPRNDSKGCGGVMRAAPVGLVYEDPEAALRVGNASGLLTHEHLDGWLPAGALAMAVSLLVHHRATLPTALDHVLRRLQRGWPQAGTTRLLEKAIRAVREGTAGVRPIGEGWTGDEALAIAVYAALAAPSLEEAIVLAVNHGGDSDSTGAIAGNLLGAVAGLDPIPQRWLDGLELRAAIESVADDLSAIAPSVKTSFDASWSPQDASLPSPDPLRSIT